jgi:hypothetical protein
MWRPTIEKEDSDDRFAEKINAHVEAMSDRRLLLRYVLVLTAVNILIWLSVLIFPGGVRDGFTQVWDANSKLAAVVLAIGFGIGMWLTYGVFRLKFPDIEEQRLDADVMGSFAYQSNSTKRWMVWLGSAIGGLVNLLLLIGATIALSS